MCTGAELAMAIGSVASAGAAVYSATQKPPTPQAPKPPPQASVAPDAAVLRRQGQKPLMGAAPTLLTGAGGVDPASLTIGRNTLLGG